MCIRDRYEGPYKVKSIKGGATYEVPEVNNPEAVRDIFNVCLLYTSNRVETSKQ